MDIRWSEGEKNTDGRQECVLKGERPGPSICAFQSSTPQCQLPGWILGGVLGG